MEIVERVISQETDKFMDEFLDFQEIIHNNYSSEGELLSREDRRHKLRIPVREGRITRQLYCVQDGRILGRGLLDYSTIDLNNTEYAELEIDVLPDHENTGIVSEIIKELLLIANRLGKSKIEIWVKSNNTDRLELIKKLPLNLSRTEINNRLYRNDINFDYINSKYNEFSEKLVGYDLVIMNKFDYDTNILNDDLDFAEVLLDFINDVQNLGPMEESERADREMSMDTLKVRAQHSLKINNNRLNVLLYDGTMIVGRSHVKYPITDTIIQVNTGFTAVRKAYQGKGIATYLKIVVLKELLKLGFEYLDTENSKVNAAMLKINTNLGFRKNYLNYEYSGNLEDMMKYYNLNQSEPNHVGL